VLFSILNSSASTVLAVNLALVALMMAPHVENRRSTVADDAGMQIQLLVEMDILPITSIQRIIVCRWQWHCTT